MKNFFTKLLLFFLLFLAPVLLLAQQKRDYNIMLNSGKFVPSENVMTINKNSAELKISLFGGVHYVALQFNELPTESIKASLKKANVNLIDYLPNLAYTATLPESMDISTLKNFNVRSVFVLTASQRTTQDILAKKIPSYAVKQAGYVDVSFMMYEYLTEDKITNDLKKLKATILLNVKAFKMYTIRLPQNKLQSLLALPYVQWVELIAPNNVPENLPGRTLHRVNTISDGVRNLKGDGMNIGIFDEIASQHLDFSPAGRMINVDAGAAGSHGTHVSGTVGGKGIINPLARGMAPNATIFSYYGFAGDVQATMAVEIPAKTLISSNHSYHDGLGVQCGLSGASVSYSLRARNTDINLNDNLYHLHCHSAGNNQTACASGWGTITGTGKAAKNNLVVAAIDATENMASFSSFGPVHDGRVKPEISAMGVNVFSTYTPLNTYSSISGTSMSTPGITGTVALLAQRYKQLNANVLPPSALIKNIACNAATDLGNAGPDYRFGFGRINSLAAVKILEENRYELRNVANGAINDKIIVVPAGAARLRAMLTWNDPAASANVSQALVNNLDLTVVNGATTTLPWILDPLNPSFAATKAIDNISNIEQVTINNPTAGSYTLRVNGAAITTGANQPYALTWIVDMPYIEVTYPNGNESLNPATTEIITWDNAGVTGNQTIEYSLNNGASWTMLSNAIPATTTRISWSVPAANTSTALVRISSGSITDVSDANFKILGTTTGFSVVAAGGCSAGEVSFQWNAVANATVYDIYRLDAATGSFVIQAANIVGTTYTATGLTSGASLWFTIVAKNTATGAVSERANAINPTVSSGGGGLGVIGAIAGQSSVCGSSTNVPFTLPAVVGATNYTWAVPAGATIASGQGSTSIAVNFPAGSVSGNVTVFASSGACITSTVSKAVIIGAAVAQPTAGSNQSQIVCPGNAMPNLIATATTIPGNTLVWYDAATGGNIVATPNLNTAGTAIYYAAAKNTVSGCESATRAMVTLTINQVAASTIAASGATTFCQPNTVTLTASPNTSWLWSNGATTQSITVAASGAYTVTGTTGACVSASPATNVVANALPTATITAGSATTFCQGQSVVLTASAGTSWLWSNGATTQSITVNNTGSHTVTVTNAAGCNKTSTATAVTVNANPAAVIAASGVTTFCQGGNVMLTANAGSSYLWSNGATTQSITVPSTGAFSVAVTQVGGCISNSSATNVTVNPLPVAAITAAGATSFCQGSNVVLTASAGNSWLWSNGATSQSITASSTGNYAVTVSTAAGCSSLSTATAVAVSTNPTVSISANPYTKLYPGLTTTLTATAQPAGNYIYTWLKDGNIVSNANTATLAGIDLNKLGSYEVKITNAVGLPCANTSAALAISDSITGKMYVYPSPNNGQFSVAYYTSIPNQKITLAVYDSKGGRVFAKIYTINAPYQLMDVDIRNYAKAVYNVVILDAGNNRLASSSVVLIK
jgi:hypothetical protein